MLRSTRSFGSLRAMAKAQPQSVPSIQRHLASSVLLSQAPWERMTVSKLKDELSKRNIALGGLRRKEQMISKLKEFESHQIPAVPSQRNASSTSSSSAAQVVDNGPAVSTDTVTAPPSTPISTQATESESLGGVLTSETEAPGLPENPFSDAKMTLDLKFPETRVEPESATPIPWILAFNSNKFVSSADSPSQSKAPEAFVPKVFTTASTSTHPGGGPLSATSATTDLGIEDPLESAENAVQSLTSAERNGLIVLGAILTAGFLAGGVFKPQTKEALAKAEELAQQGKQKAVELKDDARAKAEEVKGEVKGKYEEIKGKADGLVEEGKKKAEEGKAKAEGLLKDGKKAVKETYKDVKGKAGELAKDGEAKLEQGKAKGKKVAEDVKEKVGAK